MECHAYKPWLPKAFFFFFFFFLFFLSLNPSEGQVKGILSSGEEGGGRELKKDKKRSSNFLLPPQLSRALFFIMGKISPFSK